MCSSRNKQNVKIVFFFWRGSQVCGISRTPNLFAPPHQQPFSHNKRVTHRFCANLHACLGLVYIQAKKLFPFYVTWAFAEKNSTTRRFLSCHCSSSSFFSFLWKSERHILESQCQTRGNKEGCSFPLWWMCVYPGYGCSVKMRRTSVFAGLITIKVFN